MKPKVLIVDDSKTARLAAATALAPFACQVLEAQDGGEGFEVARRERPDLILLDVSMSGVDGVEMLTRLRSCAETRGLPVIMLTGENNRAAVLKILKMSVRDYLVKPFVEADLVARVGAVIDLVPLTAPAAPRKRFEDPLTVLLVDDKEAVCEQIKQGLSDTTWTVETRSSAAEAVEFCGQTVPDVVLASLSLAGDTAFEMIRKLAEDSRTRKVPVLGMTLRTAADLQRRGLQCGVADIITKPVNIADLKAHIARGLNLDTSSHYFEVTEGVLVVRWPESPGPDSTADLVRLLPGNLAEAVDAGIDKIAIDLCGVRKAHAGLIRTLVSLIQMCGELSMKYRLVALEGLAAECRKFDEAFRWEFSPSREEAVTFLNTPEVAVT